MEWARTWAGPRLREITARDFDDGQALVIEPEPQARRWMAWHIRTDDLADGWVRRDWLQEVEQGFAFGEETAIRGLNC